MFARRIPYESQADRQAGTFVRQATSGESFLQRFARNKLAVLGALILIIEISAALLAPVLLPYELATDMQLDIMLQPESVAHPMGTDENGRDELARVLYGARTSLQVSFLSVALGMSIGIPIGLLSGYRRGFLDEWIVMRVVDAFQAFPFLILALALAAALGTDFRSVLIAIGIGFMPGFIRVARAQALSLANLDYIVAARAMGASDIGIIVRHIFPNSLPPLLVQTTLAMGGAILFEAALSYLGMGVQPPEPTWGQMLNSAQLSITSAPWLAYWPGLAIYVSVLGFNLFGDGLRDALDPRVRH